MELSPIPVQTLGHASCAALPFEVALPPALARFGTRIGASLAGPEGAPLIVVLGGISAHRFPCDWWPGVAGEDMVVDPTRCRVLGVDFIADRQGRRAPTTADQAAAIAAVLDAIGAARAFAFVGASYGGMIALAFGQHFPDRVERLVAVSAAAAPHPAATAIRELQRRVVALGLEHGAADEALSIARGLAMLTYRTPDEFAERFAGGIGQEEVLCCSEPGSYLRARGDAFRRVMSPERFLSLSASIDRHRVDPASIPQPVLLVGAESDQLVPPGQLRALQRALAGPARLALLPSLYGHDMFLKEATALSALIRPFLQ
ncbi:MAG TPA: homoserine O-succinyltransferase [Allosphingosinicella sp.]|nr:homoserine O-succinyltransferase [Allosphingosinicella sp.]